jgi:hypothetical protein
LRADGNPTEVWPLDMCWHCIFVESPFKGGIMDFKTMKISPRLKKFRDSTKD